MATANPYKPDGTVDTSIDLNIIENPNDDLPGGGYYIPRYMRVPMKVGAENKHVAIFPKTIASQVVETTTKAFVTKSSRDILEQLGILNGADETQHLTINGITQPSYYDIEAIQDDITTLSGIQDTFDTSLSDHDERIGTLEDYFDVTPDTENIIDKWHEIVAFLDGIDETDNLADLIESAASNLLSTNNIWTGTNTFNEDLKAANFETNGYVQIIQSSDFSTKYEHGQISRINDGAGFNTTLIIPNAEDKSIIGTIAIREEIPYIGFVAPSAPKAGDMWFSA